jgi:hypothetical protein
MGLWGGGRVQRDSVRLTRMSDADGDAADAQFIQSMLQLTITNADLKTSVLVGAIALTFGVGTPALPLFEALEPGAWLAVVGAVIGIVAIVLCGIAGVYLVLSLRPRMKQREFSRYSLPDIVGSSVDELVATSPGNDRREAWVQVKNLADISAQKHAHIRQALIFYPVSVILMVIAAAIGVVVRAGVG